MCALWKNFAVAASREAQIIQPAIMLAQSGNSNANIDANSEDGTHYQIKGRPMMIPPRPTGCATAAPSQRKLAIAPVENFSSADGSSLFKSAWAELPQRVGSRHSIKPPE
jgi:hypothetical protein